MSTQIQAVGDMTPQMLQTIKDTLTVGATPAQFNLFVQTAAAAGLNPLLNHIYCIVYGGKMSIQISVEGIMFLAKRVDGYAGVDVQLVYENELFKAKRVRGEDGKYFWDVEHEIGDSEGEKVIGCYVFAYREGFPPVFEYMKVKEVEHNLTGTNSGLWKKYFNDMFKKHVMKRALKRQFGIEIAEDDNGHNSSEGVPEYKPNERKDITAEASHTDAPKQPEPEVKIDPLKQAMETIQEKFKLIGIHDKDKRTQFYSDNKVKMKDWKNPTIAELQGVIMLLDQKIADKQAENEAPIVLEE